jgi:Lysylphosphatidylglycerol synthase TM region
MGAGELQTARARPVQHATKTRRWKRLLPFVVSTCLVLYLVWKVSPRALLQVAVTLDWQLLVPATALLVLCLYLWDSLCIARLFSQPKHSLTYLHALQARGFSYLLSAVNYELGQAMLAWKVAQRQGTSVLTTAGACLFLMVIDLAVLLGFGLIGALLQDQGGSSPAVLCGSGLVGLVGGSLLTRFLPGDARAWLAGRRWGFWVGAWSWRKFGQLLMLRCGYYLIILSYAATGLAICCIPASLVVVCSVIPLVLLADGLPISVSGLGTRETALLYLLDPDQPEKLLAYSLVWSAGLVVGRLGIGLAHWWIPSDTLALPAQASPEREASP